MTIPDVTRLYEVLEATWPPAAVHRAGPWIIRDGQGGGKRVSAATASAPVTRADLPLAEAAMRDLGQPPLFMLRAGEDELDDLLAREGYRVVDPVSIHVMPAALTASPTDEVIPAWPPVAAQRLIWAQGGIGPERLAVMNRTRGPATTLLARAGERAAGTAFVAADHDIAMLHAVEVAPGQRRKGAGHNILIAAARWAQDQGCTWLSLVVTRANLPAQKLYSFAGMQAVGHYHYRMK
ncbi:GNAT family N-acetyltransferase [Halodurantibacterium flavum]|uniref:GNAT family N-acetyltransferase n=1 Tax=Halodurantibacterium flavum TaxID=1382802 RepID=A0ABW4S9A5_9RHOB